MAARDRSARVVLDGDDGSRGSEELHLRAVGIMRRGWDEAGASAASGRSSWLRPNGKRVTIRAAATPRINCWARQPAAWVCSA